MITSKEELGDKEYYKMVKNDLPFTITRARKFVRVAQDEKFKLLAPGSLPAPATLGTMITLSAQWHDV